MDALSGAGVGNRAPSFGELHFGEVKLGDVRRVKRLVRTADRIMQRPGETLPDKRNDPAALKGLYRLVQNEQVTHAAVLSQHQALVRQRMEVDVGDVLLIHDSTELDYTGKTTLADLGYVGKGHRQRGYISHHSLAVIAGTGDVLGLASQILHRRPAAPEGETRRQRREKQDRESRLWQQGCAAAGPAPAGKRVIDIADRGADLFEFLDYERQQDRRYVVRSRHDRTCDMATPGGTPRVTLHAYARGLAGWGQNRVDVQGRDGKADRTATVRIAAAEVRILPPKLPRGQHGQEPLPVWVVYVGETDPPPHVEPLEWILLTNEPMQDLTTVRERVSWYTYVHRPVGAGDCVVVGGRRGTAEAAKRLSRCRRRYPAGRRNRSGVVRRDPVGLASRGGSDGLDGARILPGCSAPGRPPEPQERSSPRLAGPMARLARTPEYGPRRDRPATRKMWANLRMNRWAILASCLRHGKRWCEIPVSHLRAQRIRSRWAGDAPASGGQSSC